MDSNVKAFLSLWHSVIPLLPPPLHRFLLYTLKALFSLLKPIQIHSSFEDDLNSSGARAEGVMATQEWEGMETSSE